MSDIENIDVAAISVGGITADENGDTPDEPTATVGQLYETACALIAEQPDAPHNVDLASRALPLAAVVVGSLVPWGEGFPEFGSMEDETGIAACLMPAASFLMAALLTVREAPALSAVMIDNALGRLGRTGFPGAVRDIYGC